MEKKKSVAYWLYVFIKPHIFQFVSSFLLSLLSVIISIMPYFVVSKVIILIIDGKKEMSDYLIYIVIMLGLWILRTVLSAGSIALSHKATFSVMAEIRKNISEKLGRMQLGDVQFMSSGKLKNIMVDRVDSIESILAHLIPELIPNIILPVGIVIYMFVIDWRMALASLITLPIGIICFMGIMAGYSENFKIYTQKNENINSAAVEFISGIEVIKIFNQEKAAYHKYATATYEAAEAAIVWMKKCSKFMASALAIFPAVLIGVIPVGCYLVNNNMISLNNFILSIILSLGIMYPIIIVTGFTDDFAKISVLVDDIAEMMTYPEMERPEKTSDSFSGYDITFENVTFGYNDKDIIKNISFQISEGDVAAFVGPSGGGKSTIVKLIASMWDVKSGSVMIGGNNIKDISLYELNENIAYVSQDNFLFNDTIRNNIRIGDSSATDDDVVKVAKRSGCHEFIMKLDNGYDTIVGDSGGRLSGGERQRISIARAMLKNAPIVILDEATAFTDPENEAVVQKSIANLIVGKTLIVIAHRLSTIIGADKIFVVNQGRIDGFGTHNDLLSSNETYKNMWDSYIESYEMEGR